MSDRARDVETLFFEALERPEAERELWLRRSCDDPELRAEVSALLAADSQAAEAFLETPAVSVPVEPPVASPDALEAGRRLGPYRVRRKIGSGGMSEVYLGVRDDDAYRRDVAIKVVRYGTAGGDLARRLETERRILGGLEHPNVATILDGGTTAEGLPYYVMEYIDGEPIDRYCDRRRLSIDDRIELFLAICEAVQLAHRQLIVHRDIKASNVLVGADGTPKLLDFGIAKLIGPDRARAYAEATATSVRPMTPRYASPEQVRGERVGTPTDVYSLGVLLYRLLTGRGPYLGEGDPAVELTRLVLERDPQRPSEAARRSESSPYDIDLDGRPVTAESAARARSTTPGGLARTLAGDLDNIVLTALRKEPQHRYGSVDRLVQDLRAYLDGLPVSARPATVGYKLSKFLKRNRVAVAVGVAFVALVSTFAIVMAMQAARIADERDVAQTERDRAQQVVALLEELFESPDPFEALGHDPTAREILERGEARVSTELGGQPEVQAALLQTISTVYANLGLWDRAQRLGERALRIRRTSLGERHPDVADSAHRLGVLRGQQGDLDAGERLLREALDIRGSRVAPEDVGPEAIAYGETLNFLGIALRRKADYDEAERVYREAHEIFERAGDPERLAEAKNNLAALLLATDRMAESERLFRQALALRRETLGPVHPYIAQGLSNLGACLGIQGKYEQAEPPLRESLAMYRELLDPGHPVLVEPVNNLGRLLHRKGELDEAERYYREALELQRGAVGELHPSVGKLTANLAELQQARGDLRAAEATALEALRVRRATLPEDHNDIAASLVRLASIRVDDGRAAEATGPLRDALAIYETTLPPDHVSIADARSQLGAALTALGRFDEAEPHVVEAYRLLHGKRGPDHVRTRAAWARVVDLYEAAGTPDRAAAVRLHGASS